MNVSPGIRPVPQLLGAAVEQSWKWRVGATVVGGIADQTAGVDVIGTPTRGPPGPASIPGGAMADLDVAR